MSGLVEREPERKPAPTAPVTKTLRQVFKRLDGTPCSVLTLRHYLTAGDIFAAQRDGGDDLLALSLILVCRVTGLDRREIDDVDIRDVEDVIDHIEEIRKRDPKA